MTRVYLADAKPEERSALRLLLLDLMMEVVGEAADWSTAVAQIPFCRTDMLLVDWELLTSQPATALEDLRKACPAALIIILISQLDARQQAALSAGADAFISKGETPERVAEHLRAVAASIASVASIDTPAFVLHPVSSLPQARFPLTSVLKASEPLSRVSLKRTSAILAARAANAASIAYIGDKSR